VLRYALKGLAARLPRAGLTLLVVAVGVAATTGALVFTDTIRASFDQLFTGSLQGAQLTVSGLNTDGGASGSAAGVPVRLVAQIGRLPGVAAAAGQISDTATIVGRGGRPIATGRLPALAISYLQAPFTGLKIVAGAPPHGPGQLVLDPATAKRERWRIGDLVSVLTAQPAQRFRLVGLAALGPARLTGQPVAVFDLPAAQSLFDKTGSVDQVDVAVVPGYTTSQVSREIRALLPAELVVRGRRGEVDGEVQQVATRLRSLSQGLLAFALVAVAVGALLIFNTFAATAVQRGRELALMRALGATRLQVLAAAVLEAGMIGALGTVLGLVAAPLVALGARLALDPVAAGLPDGGLVLRGSTVLIGAAVGVGMALAGALLPAGRSARRAPLEAMRAAAVPPMRTVRRGVMRALIASLLAAAAVAVVLTIGGTRADRLRGAAAAGGLMVAAALVLGPLLVRLSLVITGRVAGRDSGVVARLAREQLRRNPGRSAITASSLTIGLALVLVLAIYATGLQRASSVAIRHAFTGDVALENQDPTQPIPAASVRAAADIPGVVGLASLRTAVARIGRSGAITVNGLDPTTWTEVYRFRWVDGGPASLAGLGTGEVLLEQDTARAAGLSLGARATLVTGSGVRLPVTVSGIYRDDGLLRGAVIPAAWFAGLFHQTRLQAVFVRLAPGTSSASALAVLHANLRAFPGVVARSQTALAATGDSRVRALAGLVYAFLGLSLVMSLIGIAGTLGLSVRERTHELGVLRAIGMTAAQARALVRHESLLTAANGVITALMLGLAMGWAVARALAPDGFVFVMPWLGLGLVVVTGGAVGFLGAVSPAHRAARLDILVAVAHE
jgi:putative ABC transport system permease protein